MMKPRLTIMIHKKNVGSLVRNSENPKTKKKYPRENRYRLISQRVQHSCTP